jgi:hypothetical protein
MAKKIDLQRLESLIQGSMPIDKAEELFILMYKHGIGDSQLMDGLLQISDILEDLEKDEINHLLLGYALGQKTYRECEDELVSNVKNKNQSFH